MRRGRRHLCAGTLEIVCTICGGCGGEGGRDPRVVPELQEVVAEGAKVVLGERNYNERCEKWDSSSNGLYEPFVFINIQLHC